MPDNLNVLIEAYRDASSQLELAISESCSGVTETVRQYDNKLSSLFDKIVELELEIEQRLIRIEFFSELILTNLANEEALRSRLISVICADARQLHNSAHR